MIASRLRALGDDPSPAAIEETQTLYTPFQEAEPYADVEISRDVPYGSHPRQRFDLFHQPGVSGRQVVVFVHGGGYVSGDKRLGATPYYDNVALWAVRHGFVGLTMGYRLAPECMWHSGIEDVAAIVNWIGTNIGAYGGDPLRLFLMGHSAGAAHIASYIACNQTIPVAGAVLISGVYDVSRMERSANLEAYYGPDEVRYAERSSLSGLISSSVPLLVTCAEYDPHKFLFQHRVLLDARLEARRTAAPSICMPGHTHFSQVFQLNASANYFSEMLLSFIEESS